MKKCKLYEETSKKKINTRLPLEPAILLLRISTKELEAEYSEVHGSIIQNSQRMEKAPSFTSAVFMHLEKLDKPGKLVYGLDKLERNAVLPQGVKFLHNMDES